MSSIAEPSDKVAIEAPSISQFFQVVQGLPPVQSGLRILPWTTMRMLVAPIAGAVSTASAAIG